MTEDDVTRVTRNGSRVPDELKLLVDLIASAAMIYYVTHPDAFDNLGERVKEQWARFTHRVSVWNACQDIRNLPETDKGESS